MSSGLGIHLRKVEPDFFQEMVKALKGALLECDVAVKQIILELDSKMHFIIEDLDETHLFIDAACYPFYIVVLQPIFFLIFYYLIYFHLNGCKIMVIPCITS